MQLGCSIQVLGKPGLRSYDGRRGRNSPHLSVSLLHLEAILAYLHAQQIHMYRMSPDLAPYATHPDYPHLHHQVDECADQLRAIGAWSKQHHLRLSFHAPAGTALATATPELLPATQARIGVLTTILDRMELGPEAVVVVHTGSFAGGADATVARWIAAWEGISAPMRGRLALEHEAYGASLGVVLRIHAATGVPIVFDHLHWLLHNPEGLTLREALAAALATWPVGVQPKAHFATPRTELRAVLKAGPGQRRRHWVLSPPRPGHHSDFVHPWEFARFVEAAVGLRDFDILLEARASDIALLRLRSDLDRYVPEVAAWLCQAEGRTP